MSYGLDDETVKGMLLWLLVIALIIIAVRVIVWLV